MYTLLSKNQLQRLYLEMPHIQSDRHLPILLHEIAMRFIPRHRFFEDIHPFGQFDFDPRSDSQLHFSSIALGLSYFRSEKESSGEADLHLDSSLSSTTK